MVQLELEDEKQTMGAFTSNLFGLVQTRSAAFCQVGHSFADCLKKKCPLKR